MLKKTVRQANCVHELKNERAFVRLLRINANSQMVEPKTNAAYMYILDSLSFSFSLHVCVCMNLTKMNMSPPRSERESVSQSAMFGGGVSERKPS